MRISGRDGKIEPKLIRWVVAVSASIGVMLVVFTRTQRPSPPNANPGGKKDNVQAPTVAEIAPGPVTTIPKAPNWLRVEWNSSTFNEGLAIASDRREGAASRATVVQRLVSRKRTLNVTELVNLRDTLSAIVQNQNEDPALRSGAIHALTGVAILLDERTGGARSTLAADYGYMVQYAGDPAASLVVRSEALRALGDLQLTAGVPLIQALLSDPASLDEPLLARNACLSLQKLLGAASVPLLATALGSTRSEPVFGTAAFALSQTRTPEAIAALIGNRGRFPDSGSCDAALSELSPVILTILRDPNHPQIIPAVQATESLWRKGESDLYRPALHQVLRTGSMPAKRSALERLLKVAATFDFEREKQELAVIRAAIANDPDFQEQQAAISRRLTATVVPPTSGLRGPRVVPKP